MEMRTEKDSMGEMQVPANAYYGASTQRAVENFPISDLRFSPSFIRALGIIKKSAALANSKLGILDDQRKKFIIQACEEVIAGKLDAHFVVDIFQTGSGTSSNMNANEVIATRAKELAQGQTDIHPNDHVNMSQSSNDVIPTAMHVAAAIELKNDLIPGLEQLAASLTKKATQYKTLVKTGRTHLMDATPITLGQEFSGYQRQITLGVDRVNRSLPTVLELPLGGTAVGTGINTPVGFAELAIKEISAATGLPFVEAQNHFEAQAAKDALVEMSGQLKTIACSLAKVANDLRWLGSGPRCGLGEISLPAVQPGSSIMPGKVNPVISESVLMAVAQVIGNDTTVTLSNHGGSTFELNVMMPVIAYNVLQSISLLANSARNFATKCVDGLEANEAKLAEFAAANITVVTALVPKIGYDLSAKISKEAYATGKTLREVVLSHKAMSEKELDETLDLLKMTEPGM